MNLNANWIFLLLSFFAKITTEKDGFQYFVEPFFTLDFFEQVLFMNLIFENDKFFKVFMTK